MPCSSFVMPYWYNKHFYIRRDNIYVNRLETKSTENRTVKNYKERNDNSGILQDSLPYSLQLDQQNTVCNRDIFSLYFTFPSGILKIVCFGSKYKKKNLLQHSLFFVIEQFVELVDLTILYNILHWTIPYTPKLQCDWTSPVVGSRHQMISKTA